MRQKECYGTWNGGQGAIVVVDAEDADSFINFSKERGVEAKKAGKIIEKGSFTVFIRSKFGDKKSLYY
jgi:phosphoribosylaminoimidazole (AIR) synthetase